MKNKILLLSFILMSFSVSAQYFEVGMEWVYGIYTTQPGWPPHIKTMTITGDTVINGETAFIIDPPEKNYAGNPDIRYIGESGQQIFYYMNGEKRLLYDFSLSQGDSLIVKTQFCCQGLYGDTLRASVDSLSSIDFNGTNLKVQHYSGGWDWSFSHVEGVGSLYSFFPNPPLADNAWSKLRCVIYPNGDILKFTDDEDCYTLVGVNDIQQSGLSIYPNPVVDELTIENKDEKSYELRVFSQQGQMVYSGRYHNSNEQIRTTSWANGVYLLQVVVDDAVYVQRVVKE